MERDKGQKRQREREEEGDMEIGREGEVESERENEIEKERERVELRAFVIQSNSLTFSLSIMLYEENVCTPLTPAKNVNTLEIKFNAVYSRTKY